MKLRYILIPTIIIILIFGYYDYKTDTSKTQSNTPQTQVINDINKLQSTIDNLQTQVNKYKLQEQDEQLRQIRLQQLQNPEVIMNELSTTNKLLVYEGKITYNDYIKEGNWLANKSLSISLKYNIGIAIDLNLIDIRFVEATPILTIPKDGLKLEYIELDTENSKIDGDRSFFSSQFVPEDIQGVIELAQKTLENRVCNNKNLFDKSMIGLKENLRELVIRLGYSDVIFEEK